MSFLSFRISFSFIRNENSPFYGFMGPYKGFKVLILFSLPRFINQKYKHFSIKLLR